MSKLASGILLGTLLFFPGCATQQNHPNLNPEAVKDTNLTTLVDAIGALQLAAENATTTINPKTQKPLLDLHRARMIVHFCVDANDIIGTAPSMWFAIVSKDFQKLKDDLTEEEVSSFGPYLTTFEIVLNSFSPVGEINGPSSN